MARKIIDLNLGGIKDVVNEKFWPLFSDKNKFIVMRGGAGSSKSYSAAQKIIFRVLLGMGTGVVHHFLVLRKTGLSSRESTFKLIKDICKQWGLCKNEDSSKDIVHIREKMMSFIFENGSTIICAGLDDPEKIKSIHDITGIWMEEATQFDRNDLYQLDLRMRGEKPTYFQIMLTFNPVDRNHWIYDEFFREKRPEATLHHSTYKDNKWIGAEYEEKLNLYSKNPYWYTVYCLGEWGVFEGAIYTNWKIIHRDDWPSHTIMKKTILGLDFGYNEPTALLEIGKLKEYLYIKEHIYKGQLTVDELVDLMKDTILMNGKHITSSIPIYCDNNEPSTIKHLQTLGYNAIKVEKGRNTVIEGIKHVQAFSLLITSDSEHTIKEIQGYRNKLAPDGETFLDDPIPVNDHAMSALRYAVWMEHVRPKKIYGVYSVSLGA